jgi:hypothetical protein
MDGKAHVLVPIDRSCTKLYQRYIKCDKRLTNVENQKRIEIHFDFKLLEICVVRYFNELLFRKMPKDKVKAKGMIFKNNLPKDQLGFQKMLNHCIYMYYFYTYNIDYK